MKIIEQYKGLSVRAKKKNLAIFGALVCGVVWAATQYGPFGIATGGANFANYSFAIDQEQAWEGAFAVYQHNMVPKFVGQPAAQAKAVKNGDYVRIVYHDGTIADFTIVAPMTGAPVVFKQVVPSATYKHISVNATGNGDTSCANGGKGFGGGSLTYSTGYWGSEWPDDQPNTTIAVWIDTGLETISVGGGGVNSPINCR